jgi:hypothetical protein
MVHQKVGRVTHAEFLPIKTIHLSSTIYDISIKINENKWWKTNEWFWLMSTQHGHPMQRYSLLWVESGTSPLLEPLGDAM